MDKYLKNPIILAIIAGAVFYVLMSYYYNPSDSSNNKEKKGGKSKKSKKNNGYGFFNDKRETVILVSAIAAMGTWFLAKTFIDQDQNNGVVDIAGMDNQFSQFPQIANLQNPLVSNNGSLQLPAQNTNMASMTAPHTAQHTQVAQNTSQVAQNTSQVAQNTSQVAQNTSQVARTSLASLASLYGESANVAQSALQTLPESMSQGAKPLTEMTRELVQNLPYMQQAPQMTQNVGQMEQMQNFQPVQRIGQNAQTGGSAKSYNLIGTGLDMPRSAIPKVLVDYR
jgi:ElaB/YqjD/DUF883 family membrane-anchored ribosome-binding protein